MTENSLALLSQSITNDNSNYFVLDLKGFDGPLHLLLNLSRSQKVDLRQISLVELCDQYLNFIADTKRLKIEIAADYLIMASWLIFLKSELLLPKDDINQDNEIDELAENIKFQLMRLDAMRHAAVKLMSSDQLNRDFFKRGETDAFATSKKIVHTASLMDLLQAYAALKTKDDFQPLHFKRGSVFNPEAALRLINKELATSVDWQKLENLIPKSWRKEPQRRRTALATNFAVCLEQARLKRVEVKQAEMFATLYVRRTKDF